MVPRAPGSVTVGVSNPCFVCSGLALRPISSCTPNGAVGAALSHLQPHTELQPQPGAAPSLTTKGLGPQFKVLPGTQTGFEGNLLQLKSS